MKGEARRTSSRSKLLWLELLRKKCIRVMFHRETTLVEVRLRHYSDPIHHEALFFADTQILLGGSRAQSLSWEIRV